VPAVEAREGEVVLGRDARRVEGRVVRVAQRDVGQALVRGDEAVADDLDLGLVWDGLEVGVQDRALRVEGLAVAIAGGGRVEEVREAELGGGGDVGLVLEDEDLVGEEGIADGLEGGILDVRLVVWAARLTRRLPIPGVLHSISAVRQGLPVRRSMSTPDTTAPKSTAEPAGWAMGAMAIWARETVISREGVGMKLKIG
jgi:hypothetical protein